MIDITNLDIRCFASYGNACKVLSSKDNCNTKCPFYKPVDCEDWVRIVEGDRVMICEPEEAEWKKRGGAR